MSTVDPIKMATKLATADVKPFQRRYQVETDKYKADLKSLNTVETAFRDFRSTVQKMNSPTNSIQKNGAKLSRDGFFSASANAHAQTGHYQLFVEQVASAHQVSTSMPANIALDTKVPAIGTMKLAVGKKIMTLDLAKVAASVAKEAAQSGAAKNKDNPNQLPTLTLGDLIQSINNDADNPGINATLVRSGGKVQLMLAATETGQKNRIGVSVSGTQTPWFEQAFSKLKQISAPKDSVVWLGAQGTGLKLTNSSNQLDNVIDGITLNLTKPQVAGDPAISLDITPDKKATKEQISKFVDAYNALTDAIGKESKSGNETEKRGALAGDPTILSIENQLKNLLQKPYGGLLLGSIGISLDRKGRMVIDNKKLEQAQQNHGNTIERIFNGDGNLLDSIDKMAQPFLKFASGMFSSRKDTFQKSLSRIDDKKADLQDKYKTEYKRYLKQFTHMNEVVGQMKKTQSMFG